MTGPSEGRRLRVGPVGAQVLVEDLGRPGLAGVGVGRSGAADRSSLRLANRLLGNPETTAALEVQGGLEVEVLDQALYVVVTGAPCEVHLDDRPVGSHGVLRLSAGARLRLGPATAGLRSYLGVRGGVDVAEVLGSRSHDVLAELGPDPVAEGDVLAVGPAEGRLPDVDAVPPPAWREETVWLRAVRGPRDEWVADVDALVRTGWQVSDRTNRVGARLTGGTLEPASDRADEQLPSEGAWRGAVQVPPSGEPVLFLADHPVTGGYPVVAVVVDEDVDRASQLRPGQQVRIRWVEAP